MICESSKKECKIHIEEEKWKMRNTYGRKNNFLLGFIIIQFSSANGLQIEN